MEAFGEDSMDALLAKWYEDEKLSAIMISRRFGKKHISLTPARVRQLLEEAGVQRREATVVKYPPSFWEDVDWKKSDQQIADEKGADPTTVKRWRKRLTHVKKP